MRPEIDWRDEIKDDQRSEGVHACCGRGCVGDKNALVATPLWRQRQPIRLCRDRTSEHGEMNEAETI